MHVAFSVLVRTSPPWSRIARSSTVRWLAIFAATMYRATFTLPASSSARRYCSRRSSTFPLVKPRTAA